MTGSALDRPDQLEVVRAQSLIDIGQYAQAADRVGRHLARSPEDPHALAVLSRALLGAEDWSGAAAAAGRSAALAPDQEWPHRLASVALQQLGQRREALCAARAAVRLAPDEWQTHSRLAQVLLEPPTLLDRLRERHLWSGRLDEAQREASLAAQLAPWEPDSHATVGHVALARGHRGLAEEAFERALALSPQAPGGLHALATAQALQGRLSSALGGFAAVAAVDPQDASAAYNVLLIGGRLLRRLLLMLLGLSALALSLAEDLAAGAAGPPPRAVPIFVFLLCGVLLVFLRTVHRLPPGARRVLRRAAVRGWGLIASGLTVLTCALLIAAVWPSDPPRRLALAFGAWMSTLLALYACSVWIGRRRADFERTSGKVPWWRYQRRR